MRAGGEEAEVSSTWRAGVCIGRGLCSVVIGELRGAVTELLRGCGSVGEWGKEDVAMRARSRWRDHWGEEEGEEKLQCCSAPRPKEEQSLLCLARGRQSA